MSPERVSENNLFFFLLLLLFSEGGKNLKRFTGRGIMMSKRVKHNRIYGPIKEQKKCLNGETNSRPDHSFLLTSAGLRGESWRWRQRGREERVRGGRSTLGHYLERVKKNEEYSCGFTSGGKGGILKKICGMMCSEMCYNRDLR